MPRHVVLLSRDSSLAVTLRMLLGEADVVTEISRPAQWPSAAEPPVSVAVLDLPPGWRQPGIQQVRARFSGPLVVLLGQDEDAGDIPAEHACTIMRRPFEIMTLWSLVTSASATPGGAPASEPPAGPPPEPRAKPASPPKPSPETAGPSRHSARAAPQLPAASRATAAPPPSRPGRPAAAATSPASPEPAPPPVARPARLRQPEPKPEWQPSRPQATSAAAAVPGSGTPAASAPPGAAAPAAPPAAATGAASAPRAAGAGPPGGEPVPDWSGRLRRLHNVPAAVQAPAPSPSARPQPGEAAPPETQAPPPQAPAEEPPIDLVAVAHEDASPLPGLPVQERLQRLRDLPNLPRATAAPGGQAATTPLPDDQPSPGAGPGSGERARRPREDLPAAPPAPSPGSPAAAAPPAAAIPPVAAPRRPGAAQPAVPPAPAGASPPPASPWPSGRPPAAAGDTEALLAELREAAAEARRALDAAGATAQPDVPAEAGAAAGGDPIAEALGGEPPERYERDLPQQVVEQAAERATADVVALLLDNGEGVLEVRAGKGLSAAERRLRVDYSREVIRELFRVGVGLIDSTEQVRGALTAIPGSEAGTLVMLPLVQHGLGFGALIAGRNRQPSGPPPPFEDPEVERLMDLATAFTPALRTAVLISKLRHQLAQR